MTTFRLSSQAISSFMLAVQKGALAVMMKKSQEECDITQLLKEFELENTVDGLVVVNPPSIEFDLDGLLDSNEEQEEAE